MSKIKHPLERYELIASPIIRKQCVKNFDEKFYYSKKHLDNGHLHDAIMLGFDWRKDYGIYDNDWCEIYSLAFNGKLELKTITKQQTAVNWLIDEIKKSYCGFYGYESLLAQAISMDKQQKMDAYKQCYTPFANSHDGELEQDFNKYYYETYE
jgi:hypothetical protein